MAIPLDRPPPRYPEGPDSQAASVPRCRTGRRLLLASVLATVAFLVAAALALSWLLDRKEGRSDFDVAQEFVSSLKLGEEQWPGGSEDSPIGYARAWALLSKGAQERIPYESFYQAMLFLTREHGPIMAGEPVRRRAPKRRGARREIVFKIVFGDPHQVVEDMTAFHLRLTMGREEDRWVVAAYEFVPVEPQSRQ
jgi:hypothetical protein